MGDPSPFVIMVPSRDTVIVIHDGPRSLCEEAFSKINLTNSEKTIIIFNCKKSNYNIDLMRIIIQGCAEMRKARFTRKNYEPCLFCHWSAGKLRPGIVCNHTVIEYVSQFL